jgi:hypothetical protein
MEYQQVAQHAYNIILLVMRLPNSVFLSTLANFGLVFLVQQDGSGIHIDIDICWHLNQVCNCFGDFCSVLLCFWLKTP